MIEPELAVINKEQNVDSALVLRATNIRKAFGRDLVLDDIHVELRRGEVVLLVGENGSGKTTLLNILTGNLEPDAGTIEYLADETPRRYHFPRPWWRDLNPWDHFRPEFVALEGMSRTWQDVRLFPSQSVLDNITIACPKQPGENPLSALIDMRGTNRSETKARTKSRAILDTLGIANDRRSLARILSYGQSKRVAIARAIAAESRVLFLDEPLSGLDHRGIDDTLDLLKYLIVHNHLTLVIVEHLLNQPQLRPLVTNIWSLDNGRLTNSNAVGGRSTSRRAEHPRWLRLLTSKDSEVVDEALPRGAILTRVRPRHMNQAHATLELQHLVVNRGNRTILGVDEDGCLQGLTLALHPGELAVLQAPNGWGKTTLFSSIAGLHPIAAGSIQILGRSLVNLPPWQRARAGLRVALAGAYLFDSLTMKQTLELAGSDSPFEGSEVSLSRRVNELSGGQRQMLALNTSIAPPGGRVFLFDEPFSQLDAKNIEKAAALMRPTPESSVLISVPITHQDE